MYYANRIVARYWMVAFLLATSALQARTIYTTLPLPKPSASLTALSNFQQQGEIQGYALLPFYQDNHIFYYAALYGRYAYPTAKLGSVGLGMRYWMNTHDLIGAYLFTDYFISNRQHHFWLISPGIEMITPTWSIHSNAYIPIKQKSYPLGFIEGARVSDGRYQNQINTSLRYDQFETVQFGLDARVERRLPMAWPLHLEIGGYFFHHPHQSTQGVLLGINMPLNRYCSVKLSSTRDNVQGWQWQGGLRLSLGGSDPAMKPMMRHIAPLTQLSSLVLQAQQLSGNNNQPLPTLNINMQGENNPITNIADTSTPISPVESAGPISPPQSPGPLKVDTSVPNIVSPPSTDSLSSTDSSFDIDDLDTDDFEDLSSIGSSSISSSGISTPIDIVGTSTPPELNSVNQPLSPPLDIELLQSSLEPFSTGEESP